MRKDVGGEVRMRRLIGRLRENLLDVGGKRWCRRQWAMSEEVIGMRVCSLHG